MAIVVNRTTFEVRESVNTPDYDPADWIINPDLTSVKGAPAKYWTLDTSGGKEALVLKDQAAQDQADSAELPQVKLDLLAQVDVKAEMKITTGPGLEVPEGSGKFISLSIKAQIKWTGWNAIADNWVTLGLPYPFRVRTVNDDDFVEIKDAKDVHDVYGRIAQLVAAILTEAEFVKSAIVAATTIQEAKDAAAAYLAG